MSTCYIPYKEAASQLLIEELSLRKVVDPVLIYDHRGHVLPEEDDCPPNLNNRITVKDSKDGQGRDNVLIFGSNIHRDGRPHKGAFNKIFEHWKFLPDIFEFWNYDNIILAGGVFSSHVSTSDYNNTDLDFFIFNMDEFEAVEKIFQTIEMLTKKYQDADESESRSWYSIKCNRKVEIRQYVIDVTFRVEYSDMKYSFIRRQWGTPEKPIKPVQIVSGFDIPSSQVYYDGTQFLMTPLAEFAWVNCVNIAFPNRASPSFAHRLKKYYNRGFGIAFLNIRQTPEQIKLSIEECEHYRKMKAVQYYEKNKRVLSKNRTLFIAELVERQSLFFEFRKEFFKYNNFLQGLGLRVNTNKPLNAPINNYESFEVAGILMRFNYGWGTVLKVEPWIKKDTEYQFSDTSSSDYANTSWKYLNIGRVNERLIDQGKHEYVTAVNDDINSDPRSIIVDVNSEYYMKDANIIAEKLRNFGMVKVEPGRQWTASFHPENLTLSDFYGFLHRKENNMHVPPTDKTITIVAAWKRKDGFFAILDRPILKMILSMRYN